MQLRWAKVWTDILRSPQLRRAIRQEGAEVAWVWVTCILLATQCGRGGDLVGDDGQALTTEDIADAAGVTVTRTVTALVTLDVLGWCVTRHDGVRTLPSFAERQESPSARRMRDKRAKDKDPARHCDAHSARTVTPDVTVEAEAEAEADLLAQGTGTPAPLAPLPTNAPAGPATKSRPSRKPAEPVALPDWLPAEPWAGFVDSRKRARKPLTPRAVALLVGKLDVLRAAGHDVGALLDTATERGWLTVYAPDGGNGRNPETSAPRPPLVTAAPPRTDCVPAPQEIRDLIRDLDRGGARV